MLYSQVRDLTYIKNALVDCFRMPKSQRQESVVIIDQFLIDLNEEIVDINGELKEEDDRLESVGRRNQITEDLVEEYRERANQLISVI